MRRWATFDCYGTLIDWNAGIGEALERELGGDRSALLADYHRLEPEIQAADPGLPYREVMARALERLASERGAPLRDREALARSLPGWPVFPEVPEALAELRGRGFSLAALSNSDRDLIDASIRAIGVPFDLLILAGEIGSYKPAHRHWSQFFARSGAERRGHVHVAQSHFHDVVPASALGLRTIWINRLGERHPLRPTRELPDLRGLADVAEALVRA